jgi:4-aminobutyrate aminotransferase
MAERHDSLREIRGRALMIGVEFPDHDFAHELEHRAFQKGLLVLGCGESAIRMSPALTFREHQARAALEIFESAVAEVEDAGS